MTDMIKDMKGMSNTPEEREFELRAHIGAIWSGGRLFIAMYTFFLASLAFSYFYLRSSNNGLLWRPDHVTAPTVYGWSIYGLLLVTAFLAFLGQARLRKSDAWGWQVAAWAGVGVSLVAFFLQLWEFVVVPFYPGSSGYASTFIGYAIMNSVSIFIVTYWLETAVARSMRLKKELGSDTAAFSMHPSAQSFRANVASMTYFMGFVVIASSLLFAMFYLM